MGLSIAYIAAGAAGMYCGNCLHDNALARELKALGHQVLLIPTYTPIRTDEEDVSLKRVFFGGINVYLQQKMSLFRHTPWLFDRLLDSPALLNFFAKRSISVRPEELGELTVSMIAGDAGHQAKELDKLVDWLARDVKPNLVHLSNALFVGMARALKQRLGVPVLCNVAGEDMFLDGLQEPYQTQANELLRLRARDVTVFVAANSYYADEMARRMGVERDVIHVVQHGIQVAGFGARERPVRRGDAPFTIGYLARVAPEKGLHFLFEAFKRLAARPGLPRLKLRAAGYLAAANRPYLAEIEKHAQEAGHAGPGQQHQFEYLGEVDRQGKIDFLDSLDCLVMPTVYPESKGLPVLEAWASRLPVVVPAHGAFPELLADVPGGLLCQPDDPESMADALHRLLTEPAHARQMGEAGRQAVEVRYTDADMAQRQVACYERVLKGK